MPFHNQIDKCSCEEKWMDIANSNYKISSKGRMTNKKDKPKKNSLRDGYVRFSSLIINGVKKNITSHILVMRYFVGDRPENYHIDHINRNKQHNCLCNLRYVTASENQKNKSPRLTKTGSVVNKRFHYSINGKRFSKVFASKERALIAQDIYKMFISSGYEQILEDMHNDLLEHRLLID